MLLLRASVTSLACTASTPQFGGTSSGTQAAPRAADGQWRMPAIASTDRPDAP